MKKLYLFIIMATILLTVSGYTLYTYGDYSSEVINGFVIFEQEDYLDDRGWFHIEGKIRNVLNETQDAKIVVEFFNHNNQPIGKTVYYFDDKIDKGEVKDYDIFKIDNIDEMNSYKLTIVR
jgi:hypothetical protein